MSHADVVSGRGRRGASGERGGIATASHETHGEASLRSRTRISGLTSVSTRISWLIVKPLTLNILIKRISLQGSWVLIF